MEKVDTVVIGAGVVGLAVARRLAQPGQNLFIIERHGSFGEETSSRNSEVVHAGIYYPTHSLKARLCVAGRDALYDYCQTHNIPHKRCGKLLVATNQNEEQQLATLNKQAEDNGVCNLVYLTKEELQKREPALQATAALLSPDTGIIDSHSLMQSLLTDATTRGAELVTGTQIQTIRHHPEGFVITARTEDDTYQFLTHTLINSAGLEATTLAKTLARQSPVNESPVPDLHFCKGNYYSVMGASPHFKSLVYPVPEPNTAGLGIHATLDMNGQIRFGPDTEYIPEINYQLRTTAPARYYDAIRKYWSALPDNALQPDYCGIRPKLQGPGQAVRDFEIQGPDDHGLAGLVNLFGIESPGLTACLAIADEVASRLSTDRDLGNQGVIL